MRPGLLACIAGVAGLLAAAPALAGEAAPKRGGTLIYHDPSQLAAEF